MNDCVINITLIAELEGYPVLTDVVALRVIDFDWRAKVEFVLRKRERSDYLFKGHQRRLAVIEVATSCDETKHMDGDNLKRLVGEVLL